MSGAQGTEGASAAATSGSARGASALFAALAANALIFGVLIYAAVLQSVDPDGYYRALQEDEALEWATFWAFAAAALVAAVAAWRERRARGVLPWFLAGVSLFCVFVAGEEISWAQRVFSYRPPAYFLEHNFQQELNVHNVVGTDLRKLALKSVILGYGVVLPLLALAPALRRLLSGAGIVAPPVGLAPAFLATFLLYEVYPWKFSGEIVELMLGLGFLFAVWIGGGPTRGHDPGPAGRRARPAAIVVVGVLVFALGLATAAGSRWAWSGQPERVRAAELETEALADDFRLRARSRCGIHKRVYSFVEKYDQEGLFSGSFAQLVAGGLPEERAAFFLDPWNSPYWIRHKCSRSSGAVRAFVYSFGPNRRRDSSDWALGGDDVGVVIAARGTPPGEGP